MTLDSFFPLSSSSPSLSFPVLPQGPEIRGSEAVPKSLRHEWWLSASEWGGNHTRLLSARPVVGVAD